jgi:hypothetical protein
MDPKANVLFTTSNDGVTQIGFKNPDGTVSVQSYGTRTSGGGKETMQQAIASKMSTETNNEGHLDRDKYLFHRKQWVDAGGNPDDFDTVFRDYRDPYNEEQYQLKIE